MSKTKKILSALLALVMVVGIMPAAAFAAPCELEEHTHVSECYTLTCGKTEHQHAECDETCEIEVHLHEDACFTLTCDKTAHTHGEACADTAVYVAQIGEDKFETLQAAADVGGSVKLLEDVAESVVITKDVTIDLNGKNIVSDGDAFEVKAGTLTINGDGQVRGGNTGVGSWTAVWANGGKAILNGGTYSVGGDSSTTDTTHQNDVIYTKNGGSVVVNGGYYNNNGTVWTLNENDANRGTVVVYGGTFEAWDPANNVSEGANTNFVAEGYKSVKDGNNYVVSKKVPVALETNIDELDFIVGVPQEFTYSTIANDDAGVMIVGASDFSDPDAIAKLEYYEPNTSTWYELNGEFGGGAGFPAADATSKFRVTFAKAGEYEFTSVVKTVEGEKILASVEATAVVREYKKAELVTNIDELEFVVGEAQEFTFSTVANDDAGTMVVGSSNFSDPDAIAKLEYYEVADGNWYELTGDFGPSTGFPMMDATSKFRVTFAKAGEYDFVAVMKVAGTDDVLCEVEATAVVVEAELPEEPVETVEITEIAFEVAAPADGEAASDMVDAVITTPDGVIAAEDVFVIWGKNDTDDIEDADWELVLPDDIFEKGAYYAAVVAFDIPEGVVIADDCVATINGEEFLDVYIDAGNEEYAPSFNAIYVFDDLVDTEIPEEPEDPEDPEEPETPIVPDVDGYETKCTKEEHKHIACDLSCDKEEHTHCFSDKCDKDHEHCYVKIEEEPEAPEYSIITGANGTWKDSSTDGMTFASDAEFADFVSVKVDGAVIDAANYDAKEGSTVITLKNAYLKTLKEGEHTLTIVSKDGEASTKFTIEHEHKLTKVEAKKETCTEKGNSEYYTCECGKWFKDDKAETEIVDKTSVEIKAAGHKAATEWSRDAKSHWHKCTVCGEAADEKKAHDFDKETGKICQTCKYDVDNPKTGSEAHITVMAVLMTMSVVVMAGVAGYFVWDKKRKH